MNNYTWEITKTSCHQELIINGSLHNDVIYELQYKLINLDDTTGNVSFIFDTITVTSGNINFINRSDITDELLLSWVMISLGEDKIVELKQQLDKLLLIEQPTPNINENQNVETIDVTLFEQKRNEIESIVFNTLNNGAKL
jgi:hypothetical protein